MLGVSLSFYKENLKFVPVHQNSKPMKSFPLESAVKEEAKQYIEDYMDPNKPFEETINRLPLFMYDATLEQLSKIRLSSIFMMCKTVEDLFRENSKYRIVHKIQSSMWRWGHKRLKWNELVHAYNSIRSFSLDREGFSVRLDYTTSVNECGNSEYSRTYLDGVFAYLVYYKGKHVMTLGFSVAAGKKLLIQQIQLKHPQENMSIDDFIQNIVPKAESIEVFLDNKHTSNLVSIVAPADPKAPNLLKWDNGFSWAYNGDVTDAVKERVKQRGGNVTGDLCFRLSWSNLDDLDLHMIEPDGTRIFFGNKHSYRSKGQLDVDMNAGYNLSREAVENIFYENLSTMTEGNYTLAVNNYNKREAIDVGFTVDMEYLGQVTKFAYEKAVRNGETVPVVQFTYSKKEGLKIVKSLPLTQPSKTIWNVKTQEFHPINLLMLSPNYWGENRTGNRHYMFMLDGCQNDGQVRGFFNEYLRQDLHEHRKVLEIVGSRMLTDQSTDQLSGLGFSSTQRNTLLARVKGKATRTVEISF